jgi:ABC-type multidrug transport system fused ATPase/permease subunit
MEMTDRDSRRILRADLWPERRALVGLVAALVIGAVLPLLGPLLLGRFVDRAAAGAPTSSLVAVAALYLVVAIGAQVATVVKTYVASRQAWTATNRLREQLAAHALGLDMAFHGTHPPGEMIERVDGDVQALAEFFVTFLVDILGSALLLVGTLIVLTYEDIWLGAALAVFVALAAVALTRVQRRAIPATAAARATTAHLFADLEEHLTAAEDLRANGAGAHVVRRFHEVSASSYRADRRSAVVGGGLVRLTNLAFTIGTALLLGVGIGLQRAGAITLGTTLVLFQYAQLVRRPLERIIDQLKQLQAAQAGATRATQLLHERATIVDPEPASAVAMRATGPIAVELRGVSFAYADARPVLRHVDLCVPAGRSLGVVGRTGSGKTTIARLVLRVYEPVDGVVLFDGVDVRNIALADLHRRVAVVTQDVQLYRGTVRDNLTLFGTTVGDDATLHALVDELGLGPWRSRLTDGLATEIGPGGADLSAGEAQLLALARVFLADPGLVILDEPSSRLDPATELLVERAVDRLLAGRTAILIAHRLSSLDRVDDIAVIDAGQVVEHGERAALAADSTSRFAHLLGVTR